MVEQETVSGLCNTHKQVHLLDRWFAFASISSAPWRMPSLLQLWQMDHLICFLHWCWDEQGPPVGWKTLNTVVISSLPSLATLLACWHPCAWAVISSASCSLKSKYCTLSFSGFPESFGLTGTPSSCLLWLYGLFSCAAWHWVEADHAVAQINAILSFFFLGYNS